MTDGRKVFLFICFVHRPSADSGKYGGQSSMADQYDVTLAFSIRLFLTTDSLQGEFGDKHIFRTEAVSLLF